MRFCPMDSLASSHVFCALILWDLAHTRPCKTIILMRMPHAIVANKCLHVYKWTGLGPMQLYSIYTDYRHKRRLHACNRSHPRIGTSSFCMPMSIALHSGEGPPRIPWSCGPCSPKRPVGCGIRLANKAYRACSVAQGFTFAKYDDLNGSCSRTRLSEIRRPLHRSVQCPVGLVLVHDIGLFLFVFPFFFLVLVHVLVHIFHIIAFVFVLVLVLVYVLVHWFTFLMLLFWSLSCSCFCRWPESRSYFSDHGIYV